MFIIKTTSSSPQLYIKQTYAWDTPIRWIFQSTATIGEAEEFSTSAEAQTKIDDSDVPSAGTIYEVLET